MTAIDPKTGTHKWKSQMTDVTASGLLTTTSDLLFTGGREGYSQALDARTGQFLWKASLGGQIVAGPMTYEVDGKQMNLRSTIWRVEIYRQIVDRTCRLGYSEAAV